VQRSGIGPAVADADLDQNVSRRGLRIFDTAAPPIGFDEIIIRVCILLYVLAVIALAVGQAEQALLEDRVLAVPQGKGKAEPLVVVAEPGEAILAQ